MNQVFLNSILFKLFLFSAIIGHAVLLECQVCEFSYLSIDFKPDSWCADKGLVSEEFKNRVQQCSTWEKYCYTEIKMTNNAFTAISRGCSDDTAGDRVCTSAGFGIDTVTCSDFCQFDRCNNNYKVAFYKEMTQARFTGWNKVLKEEQKYNEETKIRLDL